MHLFKDPREAGRGWGDPENGLSADPEKKTNFFSRVPKTKPKTQRKMGNGSVLLNHIYAK